ncbi:hypothetical protein [Mycolicibacterium sp.]|uniref:phage tail fiber protein n=1 Tax=Mycolicibacterium sp. TaxID=2320850 RepID=UPI0028A66B10|nr:hypothetical protein [Mycolicibacterium sp.]
MPVGLGTAGLANAWLNTLRNTSFTVGAVWVRLHTGDPGAAGNSALSANSIRSQVTFAAASGGAMALTTPNPYWTNGGTSETLTHISAWTSSTGGTMLFTAALGTSTPWTAGETFVLTALSVSLAPLASGV